MKIRMSIPMKNEKFYKLILLQTEKSSFRVEAVFGQKCNCVFRCSWVQWRHNKTQFTNKAWIGSWWSCRILVLTSPRKFLPAQLHLQAQFAHKPVQPQCLLPNLLLGQPKLWKLQEAKSDPVLLVNQQLLNLFTPELVGQSFLWKLEVKSKFNNSTFIKQS